MIEIIPAIDIIDGKTVRLSQGDYAACTDYSVPPEEMARRYADCGVRRIHAVDLDGALAGRPCNLAALERLSRVQGIAIEWGGGLGSEASLRSALSAGASSLVVGSVAAREPSFFSSWLSLLGGERLLLGADARDGLVSVRGWTETTSLTVEVLIERFLPAGLQQVICTDISRDGMLQGPDTQLYKDLKERFPLLCLTASGGVSSMDDVRRLSLLGLERVIVGKAVYEGHVTLKEIEQWSQRE